MKKEFTSNKSETDWIRVDAIKDEDIDFSDCAELTPDMFAKAIVRKGLQIPPKKVQVTLRVDGDVVEWFKAQGRGYQTHINALLRAYMEAHESRV